MEMIKKIRLRKIREEDLEKIMNWRMSPEVTKYMYTDPVLTIDLQRKWLESIESSRDKKYWMIVESEVPIGVVGLTEIDLKNKRCNWNWYIGDVDFRGKGIAQTVQRNICDYVFYKMKLNRLYCEVLAENIRNLKAYEKSGLYVEGILKEHIYKYNRFYDVAVCGITAAKWNEISASFQYEKIEIED